MIHRKALCFGYVSFFRLNRISDIVSTFTCISSDLFFIFNCRQSPFWRVMQLRSLLIFLLVIVIIQGRWSVCSWLPLCALNRLHFYGLEWVRQVVGSLQSPLLFIFNCNWDLFKFFFGLKTYLLFLWMAWLW